MNESSTFEITDFRTYSNGYPPQVWFRVGGDTGVFGGYCGEAGNCSVCDSDREVFNREVAARFSDYAEDGDYRFFIFDGKRCGFYTNCPDDCGVCNPDRDLFAKLTAGGFDPSATAEEACTYPDCDCATGVDCGIVLPEEEVSINVYEGNVLDELVEQRDLKLQMQESLQQNAEQAEQLALFEALKTLSIIALESAKPAIEELEQTETELRGELTELSDEVETLKRTVGYRESDIEYHVNENRQMRDRLYAAEDTVRALRQELDHYQELHTNLLFAAVTGERKNEVPF